MRHLYFRQPAGRGGVPRARGGRQSEKFADERHESRLAVHGVARARPLQAHVHVRVGPDRGETRRVRRLRRDEAAAADGEANASCLRVRLERVCFLSLFLREDVFAAPSSRLRDGSRDLEPLRREQRRGRARQRNRHVVQVALRVKRALDLHETEVCRFVRRIIFLKRLRRSVDARAKARRFFDVAAEEKRD